MRIACRWSSGQTLLLALLSGVAITTLDVYMVNMLLPQISTELAMSFTQLQLVLIAYTASHALFLLPGARLGSVYGHWRCYRIGIAVFLAASTFCAAAPTSETLIIARAIQGLAAGLLVPQLITIIRTHVEERNRQAAFGMLGGTQAGAIMLAPLISAGLGALAIDVSPWRLAFLINLPIGILGLCWAAKLPETARSERRDLDVLGALILTVSLALLLFSITTGGDWGWPPWIFSLVIISLAFLGLFFTHQRRLEASGRTPLIEVSLMRNRGFLASALAIMAFYMAVSSFFMMLMLFLQQGVGLTQSTASLFYLPAALGFLTCAVLTNRARFLSRLHPLLLGPACFAIGLLWLAMVAATSLPGFDSIAPPLFLIGMAQGITIPAALNATLGHVDARHAGAAAGVTSTVQVLGTTIGIALVGAVFRQIMQAVEIRSITFDSFAYGKAFAITLAFNALSMLLCATSFSLARRLDVARRGRLP